MKRNQLQNDAKYRARKREIKPASKAKKPPVNIETLTESAIRKLESSPAEWLKYFLASAYPLPFGKMHFDIIDGAMYAVETGGNYAVAAPRGSGKSSVLWGVALFLLMIGKIRFPAYLPWSAKDNRKALRFWKNALCFNPSLAANYPDICLPFVKSGGSAQKCLTLTIDGQPTGAQLRISDGMIVLPHSKGVIGSSTINGNPRGLNHATEQGEVLRPDLILIDDPQDKETARSAAQVANVIDVIDSDVAGMAGPDKTLPCLMACTVLVAGDVADHYLSDHTPDWKSLRVPQIVTWPTNPKLWDALNDARLAGEENKDGGKAGVSFYIANKPALIDGMTVSWEHRYDKARGHPDAFYAAMIDFYRMGKAAFMAERQNEPERQGTQVYELTQQHVTRKVSGLDAFVLPAASRILVAFSDINKSGLHWVAASFSQDMTPHVAAYGKWPATGELFSDDATEQQRKQSIYKGLVELGRILTDAPFKRNGQRVKLGALFVDRGYEAEVVQKFVLNSKLGFRVLASKGYAASKYQVRKSSLVGAPFEGCHVTETNMGQYVAHNADYWREISQRSWLGELGEPGTATIFGDEGKRHAKFAEHVTCEQLQQKYNTDYGMRWEWRTRVGSHNDLGDAYTGCFVAAAVCGLSSSGSPTVAKQAKRKETRRPSVPLQ